uniref:Ribonuclease H-like domain, reverse transcriptase, RNA-dependent DNA polymerase n=1 Tax=Tanacetum cinerariifolium TaxID=118510 RepID=A0A6L2JT65_TANCI|nr:ribonuclease H-like domain, reverse transcriptase, RNA-dependent DNA polymerase [Tanacetum cinerariifolium]
MNQFCEMKGILRQFRVAITPQQNEVAERRNRTLIEAARTLLADSKLPTTFWTEVVNTACYVPNTVSKPSSDNGKKVDKDLRKENKCNDQENEDNVNSTNNVNTVSLTVNVACTNENNELPFDPNMPALEDVSIFNFLSDDKDDGTVADMNNLDATIQRKKDGTFISQDKYVAEILKNFWFTKVNTASTPMETQKSLLKDEDGEEVDVHMYRSMIGSLMYLTSSRPDIMFAVYACARYQVNLKVSHLHAVKRILRVLYELVLLFMSLKVSAVKYN